MGILFENASIIAGEGHHVLNNAYLLIEGDMITGIGTGEPGKIEMRVSERISCHGKLLLPAFFNAHTHIPMTLLRNYADDMDLQTWLFTKIFPVEDRFTASDIYAGTQLGMMEMLASGCAGFTDMYYFCDETAKAVVESGMRAYLTRGLTHMVGNPSDAAALPVYGTAKEQFASDERIVDSLSLYRHWHGAGNGRLHMGLGPHAIYTCSADYLKAISEISEEQNMGIHIHVDETRKEHEDCLQQHGKTPVAYLADLGILNNRTIAAHCVHVTEDDIVLLAKQGVTVAHNPRSNLKLASGIAPVVKMQEAGLSVALGTDGASSNNGLDMWAEMNLAALLHKGASLNPLAVDAGIALEMATVNGAKAMGFPQSGRLQLGWKADLQMVDIRGAHWQPLHNPLSAVAYSGRSSDVVLTMVDGKVLYKNGEFLTIDKEKALYNVQRAVERVF